MIFSNTAGKPAQLTDTQEISPGSGNLISRKIWLPKALYVALPYFYLFAGLAALLATLYISNWFWILPHYLLFAGACLHLGILVYRRRHRHQT